MTQPQFSGDSIQKKRGTEVVDNCWCLHLLASLQHHWLYIQSSNLRLLELKILKFNLTLNTLFSLFVLRGSVVLLRGSGTTKFNCCLVSLPNSTQGFWLSFYRIDLKTQSDRK